MSPDQEHRLEKVFSAARDLPPPERAAFLERACRGDAELRRQADSLLAAHEHAGQFLQPTVTLVTPNAPVEKATDRIGRYKLLEPIGESGFGVVWMAEQEEPVRRRVALKIIKLGMDTRQVLGRFEAERQALAMMEHPNIAKVFDGGATDTGRPYFVMELVKGIPITTYCDANKLSTRDRLALFIQVCQAVQHAHQKGIIHRDLKPSNILVTEQDGAPVPKVIDFGVAKATQARLTERSLYTGLHEMIGTPAYMSPEQAGLGALDIDTRSDIYALGALLYELLTGRTPFTKEEFEKAGLDEVFRLIREQDPPKPSTRLSTLTHEELTTISIRRQSEPARLNRLVRGDLDWIVMKALEKDRQRRYETASAFARDIERHLGSKPVAAAAPGVVYRVRKFVRRHRLRLAVAGLVAAVFGLAAIGVRLGLKNQSSRRALQAMGTNAVFTAAQSGDAEALRRLLDADPRLVGQRDAGGATPLAHAASAGSTNTLRLLLARGAAVDTTNRLGLTPLLNAAVNSRAAAVAALLEAGADPNYADPSGVTALLASSLSGSTEVGRSLLSKGARVDLACLPGKLTALQQAAMLGHADFVELLLAHGARTDTKDANGFTPLHAAASGLSATDMFRAWNSRLDDLTAYAQGDQRLPAAAAVSNRLVQSKADLPAEILRGGGQHRRVAELLLVRGADLEATNGAGCTPLNEAALHTNYPVAEVLVAHKANLNARARDGSTTLNLAALKGDERIADLLLAAGADLNLADSAGFTPLNMAVESGHRVVAKLLLSHHADPNLACPNGQTPLHTAAGRGDIESMRLLLDHGAALHPLSPSGTPLAWAVQSRQRAAVKFLLQRGAKPDVAPPRSGMTALHWAATLGHRDLAQLLLEAGASVDADSSWQGTPLNAAAAGRRGAQTWLATAYAEMPADAKPFHPVLGSDEDYVAVLRTLLAAKANVNAREPRYQRTPMFMATSQGQLAAVEVLLTAGADLHAVDRHGLTALHAASEMDDLALDAMSNIVSQLLGAGASTEARDQFRGTPLHAAANAGKSVMVALLLEAGARINAVGPNLCTPLQLAVMRGRRDVVELLLAEGADLEWRNQVGTTALQQAVQLQAKDLVVLLLEHGAEVNAGTTDGSTALMVSAQAGDPGMFKLLLEHGAQVNAANQAGWTALLVVASSGGVEAARMLLDRGANLDVAGRNGDTPLITAAKSGRLEMVKLLLEHGAPLATGDHDGFTPLHGAADHGHAEVVEFLLGRGIDVNSRSAIQYTPLHCAANAVFTNETYYATVVRVLLAHGADINARTLQNHTPLHRAAAWGRTQIVKLLLAAGADRTARDGDGKTALDLAITGKHPESAELLRGNRPGQTPDAPIQQSP